MINIMFKFDLLFLVKRLLYFYWQYKFQNIITLFNTCFKASIGNLSFFLKKYNFFLKKKVRKFIFDFFNFNKMSDLVINIQRSNQMIQMNQIKLNYKFLHKTIELETKVELSN